MCTKPLQLAGFSLNIQGSSPPGHVVNTLTGCKVFAKCTLRKMVMTRKYFSREEVFLFLFAATCLVESAESDGGSLLLCVNRLPLLSGSPDNFAVDTPEDARGLYSEHSGSGTPSDCCSRRGLQGQKQLQSHKCAGLKLTTHQSVIMRLSNPLKP